MNNHETTVRKQYDRWAGVYDRLWKRYTRKTLTQLIPAITPQSGQRILNVGSGTGALERQLIQRYPDIEIVGVDLSPKMVDTAREKLTAYPQVSFLQAESANLPFDDEEFDFVVSSSAFHYFPRPVATIQEMRRVLRPSGRIILLDWCRNFLTTRIHDILLQWMDPAYHRSYTVEEVEQFLGDADLAVVQEVQFSFDLIWGMMLITAQPVRRIAKKNSREKGGNKTG